ncbi:MAG: radical SAM protein [Candidatus Sulfotelmatobacter sp.]
MQSKHRPGLTVGELFAAWGSILNGRAPMLSIEVTRECPLSCPGCYAYGDSHLGGGTTLRELSDLRGEALVAGVLELVRKHKPLHVSLVGGEPLVRHRELSLILPELSRQGVFTLVVTSGVIPIPAEWMQLRHCRVAVSIDGLPEHHDERRKPATYARILQNIRDRQVNVHWTITGPMLKRPGYLEEYVAFWQSRLEVNRIWISLYSPQVGEQSAEMLNPEERRRVGTELARLCETYPKLLMGPGIAEAFVTPPRSPEECLFSKMSTNYSADLTSRVEPCIFGGTPDCSQCGCMISSGLHRVQKVRIAGPLKVGHLVRGSMAIGSLRNRLRSKSADPSRWSRQAAPQPVPALVQIGLGDRGGD